ncbi:MAG: bis(5'-nucleosyl)-tetraphosphatase (symmetrical) YqeK, partial [Enterocloster sp.]
MDSRVIEIRKHLKKKLDPMRFEHTLGVSYTCQALAMRYGYDLDKAELAGLLHDCAKRYDRPTMLEKCISRGIPVSESEERDPSLLHAKLGAWMAREKYGVDDEEILSAIACHTTGKTDMGMLDKILYVADYIEPRRYKAADLPRMRKLAFEDLDRACLAIM